MRGTFLKQAIQVLLSSAILSFSFATLTVQAQTVSDAQVGALVEALRRAAPQTGTEDDGLYSEWQIKPDNIPRWSRQCTGQAISPTDFAASPVTARSILVCVMRDILREQYRASGNNESVAVQRAASWWMTGDPNRYNNSPTNTYTQQVLRFYQQERGNRQTQQPARPSPAPASQSPSQPVRRSATPSPVSDAQVGALVEALRRAAPQTGTEDDGLYSEWQIKPDNIPRWSRQCTGREISPTDFAASPVTARAVLVCVMRDILGEQYTASGNNESVAVQRAASWWMTGDPNRYNSAPTNRYTQQVLQFYQQARGDGQTQQSASPSPAQPTSQPSNQPQYRFFPHI